MSVATTGTSRATTSSSCTSKFEELYDDLLLKIDEIAERVLTPGHRPAHAYSTYIERSEVPERKDVSDGKEAMENIVESFAKLIGKQRALLSLAGDAEDEGTVALMSDYISQQEKNVWMYRSYLGH